MDHNLEYKKTQDEGGESAKHAKKTKASGGAVVYPAQQCSGDIDPGLLCCAQALLPVHSTVLCCGSQRTFVNIGIHGETGDMQCTVCKKHPVLEQICNYITTRPQYEGCIVVQVSGYTPEGDNEQLSLEKHTLLAPFDVATDPAFGSYEVTLLYPVDGRGDDEKSQDRPLNSMQHQGILDAWMRHKKIYHVFTYPDRDDVILTRYWGLLERHGDGRQPVCIRTFHAKHCAQTLANLSQEKQAEGRGLPLTVVCDSVSKRGAEYMLDCLRETVEMLQEFLTEWELHVEQVHFIFPEQLVASCLWKLQEIADLFERTHSGKIYSSRSTQASVPQEHAPTKDSAFTILILQPRE